MKFLHIADLHFGKSVHGVSMIENGDQTFWVDEFLKLSERIHPDAILIAGDVYDRSAPSGEAVQLLSRMLTGISEIGIPTLIVAGNHDSVQRLSFASSLLARQNIFISKSLYETKEIEHVTLDDEYGTVNFWLLPYVYPALISQVLEDESLKDYDSAIRALIGKQKIDRSQRNILIAHQNVIAAGKPAVLGGSESMVGNVGAIDYTCFDAFDYVALGHIHAAYSVGRDAVRYAGSPMCYHFNETRQQKKGPVLVEIGEKNVPLKIKTEIIEPLHPMREMRGGYEELRNAELVHHKENEYLRLILTDRRISPEISAFFDDLAHKRGSILMEKCSEHQGYSGSAAISSDVFEHKSLQELFSGFYSDRTGNDILSDDDMAFLTYVAELAEQAEDVHKVPGEAETDKLVSYLEKQEVDV